jgi:hypothetical protein
LPFLPERERIPVEFASPPHAITRVILDTLDRHCVKATFFPVGGMALLGSKTLREISLSGYLPQPDR